MKSQNHLDRLSSLREEIVALSAVKCHMSHERVIRARDSMLPVVCSFPEGTYQRVGLCSHEVRSRRLGCSHSTARIKLGNAIDELDLESVGDSGPGPSLTQELNWLNNEIHLLDHRKGDAEKTLATILEETNRACDQACAGEKLRKAEKQVREMERLHDEYVDRIGALRDRVITDLDRMIANFEFNSQKQHQLMAENND